MRHGQGYHSVATNGHELRDPHLTGLGQQQCRERCAAFGKHDQVELLLASPLRRALQTCLISMAPCVERGKKIIALPMAEEASNAASDTGSPPELLKAEFDSTIDFDHVKHGWWVHDGEYATDPVALRNRATKLRKWIRDRPEKEIVLVAHGFFNHYLTGDVNEKGEQTTPWWQEAELRTYQFVDGERPAWEGGEDGDWAMIEETTESLQRLGGKEEEVIKKVNKPEERARGLEGYREGQKQRKVLVNVTVIDEGTILVLDKKHAPHVWYVPGHKTVTISLHNEIEDPFPAVRERGKSNHASSKSVQVKEPSTEYGEAKSWLDPICMQPAVAPAPATPRAGARHAPRHAII